MTKKSMIDEIKEKLNLHSRKFNYYYMPRRENVIDTEKAKELISLTSSNKSPASNSKSIKRRGFVCVSRGANPC